MDKLTGKIKRLNLAYGYYQKSLKIIDTLIKKTPDVDTHIWRIQKSFTELQKEIYKELEKENIDVNFKKIIKKFKK